MYLYLSLVKRKVLSQYGWKALFGLVKLTYFHQYLETIAGVLEQKDEETWHDQQEDKDKDNGSDLVI